jgi:opacity protein-like surface antigen
MKSSGFGIWLLLCVFLALPSNSEGRDLTLNSELLISGRYDDNVFFSRTDPLDDYSSIVNPILFLDYLTELTNLKVGADVRFVNYLDQTDLDTIKHKYYVNGHTRVTERLSLNAKFDYIKDTLLDSELDETGRVFDSKDRDRYIAGGGFRFDATQLSAIGMNYSFSATDYEEEAREDRDSHSVRAFYRWSFNDGLDSLTIKPKYSFIVSDNVETDSYVLTIGLTHKSSEKGTFNFFVGGRYNEESRQNSEKNDSSGFVADLSYEIQREIVNCRIGYRRDTMYDANDDLREVDRVYIKLGYLLTERMRFNLLTNYYLTRIEQENVDNDETNYFDVFSSLDYRLTEHYSLNLAYRYSQEYDNNEEDKTVNRSQVQITLVFKFPKTF